MFFYYNAPYSSPEGWGGGSAIPLRDPSHQTLFASGEAAGSEATEEKEACGHSGKFHRPHLKDYTRGAKLKEL